MEARGAASVHGTLLLETMGLRNPRASRGRALRQLICLSPCSVTTR